MKPNEPSCETDAGLPRWSIGVALGLVALVVLVASGGPREVFSAQWPVLGDQAGHDWWLSTFRHNLLAGAPLTWNDAINNGFLFGYFYFPLPPLIVSILSLAFSVPVAIKLMVLGAVLSLSVGCWQLVKGLGYGRFLQVLAIGTSLVAVLSNHPITIGGTLYDTLLGEFSLAYALGFGLCALGAYARFRRGVGSWWMVSLWGAGAVLAHVQGALVTGVALLVWWAWDLRAVAAVRSVVLAGALALGLSAWWWLPAVSVSSQSLGDTNPVVHNAATFFLNGDVWWLTTLGSAGLAIATWRRQPGAREMLVTSAVLTIALYLPFQIADTGRLLPLVFLFASVGVAFLGAELYALVATRRTFRHAGAVLASTVTVVALAGTLGTGHNGTIIRSVDPQTNKGLGQFAGAPAVAALVHTLSTLPAGRVVIETPQNYATLFGELMWPSLLPVLTNGHDASPLGLFVNATPSSIAIEYGYENLTTVYSPVVGWQPHPLHPNPLVGVRAMQALGIRYVVATTPALHGFLQRIPSVHLVATTPGHLSVPGATYLDSTGAFWVYEVAHADRVVGVSTVTPMAPLDTTSYARSMTAYLDVLGADPATPLPVIGAPLSTGSPASITNVVTTSTSIRFHVGTLHRPVLIRETYSPQWRVTGAPSVLRAEPNEMVVLPTSHTVTLRFTSPPTVPGGAIVSALSLVVFVVLVVRTRRHAA